MTKIPGDPVIPCVDEGCDKISGGGEVEKFGEVEGAEKYCSKVVESRVEM